MRRLLSLRWLARTAFALVAFAVSLRLGWWQYQRSQQASGTLQNLGYALQWPVIGGFFWFVWWKLLRSEMSPDPEADTRRRRLMRGAVGPNPVGPVANDSRVLAGSGTGPGVDTAAGDGGTDAEDDPELEAYNRYLADLNSRGVRR